MWYSFDYIDFWLGKCLSNFWTTHKLTKCPENEVLDLKIVKMAPSEGQNLTLHFFRGHISTFRTEKTSNSRVFTPKSNAKTTFDKLKNNFEKTKKMSFLSPKMIKILMSCWPKMVAFRLKFHFEPKISEKRSADPKLL